MPITEGRLKSAPNMDEANKIILAWPGCFRESQILFLFFLAPNFEGQPLA